jgi:spermidine/putrescine transport system permease protein
MRTKFLGGATVPWILLAPAIACVVCFVALPVGAIGVYSFWRHLPTGAVVQTFTFDNWRELLTDPFYSLVLLDTFRLSAITTILCALIGYPTAFALTLIGSRWKGLLVVLLFLPSWISYVVRTMSWIHVLGKNGLVNSLLARAGLIQEPLPLLFNDFSVQVGLVHFLLPLMILNVYIGLQSVDRDVVDAARTLGATGWQAFRAITFPLSLAGLSAGSLLCFILSTGTYITPLILGGPSSTYYAGLIYDAVIPQLDWPFGAALSLIFIGILSLVLTGYGRLLGLSHMFQGLK